MKNLTRHEGILRIIQREKSSVNGNPRYLCYVLDDTNNGFKFVTQVDHSHGYSVPNFEGKRVAVEIGTLRNRAQLHSIRKAD